MEIEQLAVERPEALARVAVDAVAGRRRGEGRARSSRPARSRPTSPTRSSRSCRRCGRSSSRRRPRSSRSTRCAARPTAASSRSTARSPSTPTPSSATRTSSTAYADVVAEDDLEGRAKEKDLNYVKLDGQVGIIGNGAGLVMSTLDVVAYAGEEHGGVKPANFLDIGGGASAQVMADGLEIILCDPDVRSRSSSTSSAASPPATRSPTASCRRWRCSATRRPSRWSSGSTATTSRRAAASSSEADAPARHGRRHHGRRGRQGRRAREHGGGLTDGDLPDRDSKVIVQGITGSEGTKHTRACSPRARNVVGGVNPRKAGTSTSTASRSSAPSPRRWRRPAPTSPSSSCRRRSPRRAVVEAIDARIAARRRHHRGHPGAGQRLVLGSTAQGKTTRIIGPNCPGLISPGKSNAGIIPADIARPPAASAWSASAAR